MDFQKLRQKHPIFYYHSFEKKLSGHKLYLSFYFEIEPDIHFHSQIIINNVSQSQIERLGPAFDNLVFNLGLAEIPSYWKAACPATIVIKAGCLTESQTAFWHKLLIKGMGQFYFQNKVDFTKKDFLKILSSPSSLSAVGPTNVGPKAGSSYLVPLGGGKDSIVALEVLKQTKAKLQTVVQKNNPAALNLSQAAGFNQPLTYSRTIDPTLLKLNSQGYLNGHIPITAFNSFLSILLANLFNYTEVVFANERSADEENLKWKGLNINHQYSKSLEFENDFRAYCQRYLTNKVNYFSLLRPLYELQITRLFTQLRQFPKYARIFCSCNAGQKTNSWCGECPKCLSVFLHLSPFLPAPTLFTIFGKNLYQDKKLLPLFQQLLGVSSHKPFECVGTIEENRAAAWLAGFKNFPFTQAQADAILKAWSPKHNLPEKLIKLLKILK